MSVGVRFSKLLHDASFSLGLLNGFAECLFIILIKEEKKLFQVVAEIVDIEKYWSDSQQTQTIKSAEMKALIESTVLLRQWKRCRRRTETVLSPFCIGI